MPAEANKDWRNDTPPVGQVVEAWFFTEIVLAKHDGQTWRTLDGVAVLGIEWWRPK